MPRQLVVIDPRVDGYSAIIKQLGSGYDYLLLRSDLDGITQIFDYVSKTSGFDAIHLISHGAPGQVVLGTSTLSAGSVESYKTQLGLIGGSLNPGADLLIYGCDVAQGVTGQQLVAALSRLSQSDVAASNNKTGGSGDWVLEAATGQISYPLPNLQGVGELATAPTVVVAASGTSNIKPTSASSTRTTIQDTDLVFTTDAFPFKDANPNDTLQAVAFTTLPAKGALKLNGAPVTVNQSISVSDVAAGNLHFVPLVGTKGNPYASMRFKVSDGTDYSTFSYTLAIGVKGVNHAPVAKPIPNPVSITEGKAFSYSLPSGTLKDPDNNVLTYSATGLPTGLSINTKTGQIKGTVPLNSASSQSVVATVTATDPDKASASTTLTFSFTNVSNKAPPAPTSVTSDTASGAVTVTFGTANGEVPASVQLSAGALDITSKFTADLSTPGMVKFTPKAGEIELDSQVLTATVANAARNVSVATAAQGRYTFDNAINVSVADAGKTFDVTLANYRYTFSEGTYAVSIKGFAAGDELVFLGTSSPSSVSLTNSSGSDGQLALSANYKGSNVVDVTLTNISPVDDTKVLGVPSFKLLFGETSLTSGAPIPAAQNVGITQANSSTVLDASTGNVAYTVSEGGSNYAATITKFGIGDSITFSGKAAAAISIINNSSNDGVVQLTGNFGTTVVDLTLTGIENLNDARISGFSSFNDAFGSSSLSSVGVAQTGASTVVAISPSNAASAFDATAGNFAYSLAIGDYATTISGFGIGDALSFFGNSTASLSVTNMTASDGVIKVTGVLNNQAVDINLIGVPLALDAQVTGLTSFNYVFGAGSLIP